MVYKLIHIPEQSVVLSLHERKMVNNYFSFSVCGQRGKGVLK
jgi:hypothetical protein